MDPALLREREAFKKRALAQPTVEKRKIKSSDDSKSAKKAKTSHSKHKSTEAIKPKSFDYKSMAGSSQYKFSILAKIVKFMKTRHQNADEYPLNLEEILDETNQTDIGNSQKNWLINEALVSNPKVQVVDGDKYLFKPKYNIRDRKGLLRLLRNHAGGIMEEDVEEAVPKLQKVYKALGNQILFITRSVDKKRVLYYNEKDADFEVDEEFTKLWRGTAVDGLDEKKIEEYLEKQGISSMQDIGLKKVTPMHKRKQGKRKTNFKKHNEHMGDILKDYQEAGLSSKKT